METQMNELGVLKKRKAYPNAAQKARLVELLQADEELRGGKTKSLPITTYTYLVI